MFLDTAPRPNLGLLAGLCLFICVADIRFLCSRKPSTSPTLTLAHVLLGSLNLLCSLVCAVEILGFLYSGRKGAWQHWESIFVGSLWATVSLLRLCYLVLSTGRCLYLANSNILALALFCTTTLPEQVYPSIWLHGPQNGEQFVPNIIQLATALASAILLPIVTPGHSSASDPVGTYSPVSKWWLYTWVGPIVDSAYGRRRFTELIDFPPVDDAVSFHNIAKTQHGSWAETWRQAYSNCRQTVASFKAALWKLFRYRLAVIAFWAALCGFFELTGTVGLHQLLLFLQKSPDTKFHPWFSIVLFGFCPIFRGLCMQTFEYFATHTIGDGRACISTAVYWKLMGRRTGANADIGQLQSNISTDIDRLGTLRYTMMAGFMVPVELIVASILLYRIVGWYYLPSLALLLVTRYPLSKSIISAQSKAQSKILRATDERITKTSECIRAIVAIKIFGHIQPFIQRILGERNRELKAIWHKMEVIVASESLSSVFTFLALLLCLLLYTVVGKMPLTPDVVFIIIAVFNTINSMLGICVLGAGQYAQAMVSLDRLSSFLDGPGDHIRMIYAKNETKSTEGAVSSHIGSSRIQTCERLYVKHDFEFVRSGLNVITGDVGSGKTLLLQSLLSHRQKLHASRFEPVAYASQTPWIFRGSLKENILFGTPYDEKRYKKTIGSCCLQDVAKSEFYDMEDVGDGGSCLSGGERQRTTLARAVYSHANTVVLDDVLSGLDPQTFNYIISHCILGPLMDDRTVILVSNDGRLLRRADMVVYMKDGAVSQVTRNSPDKGDALFANRLYDIPSMTKHYGKFKKVSRTRFGYTVEYIRSFGSRSFIAIVAIFTTGAQVMEIVLPAWLSIWSQAQGISDLGFYIGIFSGLGITRILLLAISLVLLYTGAWRASRDKHVEMLVAIFGATYTWHSKTPAGQVINRFSSDIASLDDTLFKTFRPVIETYLSIAFRILTVSSLIPLFLIPSITLTGIGLYIGRRYRYAATAAKYRYAGSLTPLHQIITETASGLMTIRAFRTEKLVHDRFSAAVDHHVRAWNEVSDLQRWLAVRMDLCVGLISTSVAVLAVMQKNADASMVGLSLTLTTGLCTALLYLVYLSSLLEVEMTSYRRIEDYINNLPQDPRPCNPDHAMAAAAEEWPTQGAVSIRNLSVRYTFEAGEVLKDINFDTQPGKRIAIVGRTGSGKSSLALSLLRLPDKLHGSTTIDRVDVDSVPIDQLRQRISLIPQDPTLFNGDLRFNLDPSNSTSDSHLQAILDDVAGAPNKWRLDDRVANNGDNFSQGERQLIVLARAIVSQNRILILDEGTAALDAGSEARIHAVLRARFRENTVIAITHRLHGVMNDFDQVLVLDRGQLVEQGAPQELVEVEEGWFRKLYMQGQHAR